jgi:mannose-6-phosphate isomerase
MIIDNYGGQNMKCILKMKPNRVRRNYTGGKLLEEIANKANPEDSQMPEEWLCSTVVASNPGLPLIKEEGLSKCEIDYTVKKLIDVIENDKEFYLGNDETTTFLTKWLDSKIRLHVQAHPTREFSKEHFNTPFGKFECYYIMKIRDDIKNPYIRMGFQNAPSKEEWTRIVREQDIEAMDKCFKPVPVKEGDVVFIPGGYPHAIGEGLLLLEIMEPSDLVVRCEYEREGLIVPPEARFMKKGLEFCMNVFNYEQNSVQDINDKFFVKPQLLQETENYKKYLLLDSEISKCFELQKYTFTGNATIKLDDRYAVLVVINGKGKIKSKDETESYKMLDNFFIAAKLNTISFEIEEPTEICIILPPSK